HSMPGSRTFGPGWIAFRDAISQRTSDGVLRHGPAPITCRSTIESERLKIVTTYGVGGVRALGSDKRGGSRCGRVKECEHRADDAIRTRRIQRFEVRLLLIQNLCRTGHACRREGADCQRFAAGLIRTHKAVTAG